MNKTVREVETAVVHAIAAMVRNTVVVRERANCGVMNQVQDARELVQREAARRQLELDQLTDLCSKLDAQIAAHEAAVEAK